MSRDPRIELAEAMIHADPAATPRTPWQRHGDWSQQVWLRRADAALGVIAKREAGLREHLRRHGGVLRFHAEMSTRSREYKDGYHAGVRDLTRIVMNEGEAE